MKETDFISQNADKWAKIEAQLQEKGRLKDYRNLSESFVEITEDLGYAQTYYGRRTVRVYLNTLAQKLYKKVFNTRTIDKTSKFRFWSHELPTALWESRTELSLALIVFLISAFIGVVSSTYDNGFADQILGSNYVEITKENIAKGDPMGVYKDTEPFEMFFRIMLNNLQVSVITFILGLLAGVGTLGILVRNGVMLGVFQQFFIARNIGFESFLTIWQHGTIEIASIVVAGGAGLVLGRSIIFPGTLPRSISLKFGALKGLKILLGVAPLIVLAAFIESFYTRFDDLHIAFRIATLAASLAFITGYYIILPIKRGRSSSLLDDVAPDYSESHVTYHLNLNSLKTLGEIFSDALIIFQRNLSVLLRNAALPASIITIAILLFLREDFASYYYFTPLNNQILVDLALTVGEVVRRLPLIGSLFNFNKTLWFWPLMAISITFITQHVSQSLIQLIGEKNPTLSRSKVMRKTISHFLIHLLMLAPCLYSLWYLPFYFLIGLPASAALWFIMRSENLLSWQALGRAIRMTFSGFLRAIGTAVTGILFSLLAALLLQSPTFYILFELGNDFIGFSEGPKIILEFIILCISIIILFSGIQFIAYISILNYRNSKEIKEAPLLLREINALSLKRTK
jgi:uncharacterized membrane protein SpoIIM required for sporulation